MPIVSSPTPAISFPILLLGVMLFGSPATAQTDDQSPETPTISLNKQLLPTSVIDLSAWKLTLPIPDPNKPGKSSPWELGTPDLATFAIDPWFTVVTDADGPAIQFRANHGAITTSGSKNPRSELREMQRGYPKKSSLYSAAWSINDTQSHALFIKQKVTHLTTIKPHTVCGQIHDAKDDVTVFRVEGNSEKSLSAPVTTASIWITDGENSHAYLVDANYKLGTVFTVKFLVAAGSIHYEYNGERLPYSQTKTNQGCYFKMGNYTQSNPKTAPTEIDSAYAETLIYAYQLDQPKAPAAH